MKTFADFLKAWREQTGISQAQAAKYIGASLDTYQNWEQDRNIPSGLARAAIFARTTQYSKHAKKVCSKQKKTLATNT